MAKGSKDQTQAGAGVPQNGVNPRSVALFAGGVRTAEDFARAMSALMGDLAEGAISPGVGNAIVNAGGKMLKVVEMQHRYGAHPEKKRTELWLAPPVEEV